MPALEGLAVLGAAQPRDQRVQHLCRSGVPFSALDQSPAEDDLALGIEVGFDVSGEAPWQIMRSRAANDLLHGIN